MGHCTGCKRIGTCGHDSFFSDACQNREHVNAQPITIGGWVDAKNTKPDKAGRYLVFTIREKKIDLMRFEEYELSGIDSVVTHWRNLPNEPYDQNNAKRLDEK